MNNSLNPDIKNTTVKIPLKKCWKIDEIFFVALDKSIVKKLKINENDTFLQQELTEDGILMRIKKINELKWK